MKNKEEQMEMIEFINDELSQKESELFMQSLPISDDEFDEYFDLIYDGKAEPYDDLYNGTNEISHASSSFNYKAYEINDKYVLVNDDFTMVYVTDNESSFEEMVCDLVHLVYESADNNDSNN